MRLWLSRGSSISVREQLVTQVVLSILSGDLKPDQRLPSTRELARRFHVHPNTISAGYRQLERNGWVEFRKGSGVYVRQQKPQASTPAVALDKLIADFLLAVRTLDTPLSVIRARLRQWLESQPPDHFLLIEPELELASIVAAAMQQHLTFPVQTCPPEDCKDSTFEGAIPLVLSIKSKTVHQLIPKNRDLVTLRLRSAADSLAPYLPLPSTALVGIASRWVPFLKTARTMLIAAGFHPDSLVLRDASKSNWRRGLNQSSAIICDSLTAQSLDGKPRAIPFSLLAESSLQELLEYEQFIRGPLVSQL
jgi:DNA-binding transcriptional regulator YhcF (GntR family)